MKKSFTAKLLLLMKLTVSQIAIALFLSTLAIAHENYAQLLDKRISISLEATPLEEALKKIESIAQVKFIYSTDQLREEKPVTIKAEQKTLREVLQTLLQPLNIRYKVHERESSITLKKLASAGDQRSEIDGSVSRTPDFAQIRGTVTDTNGQPMAGVNIIVKGSTRGTTTNAEGQFTIEADEDDVLVFSFIGYTPAEVHLNDQTVIDVVLMEDIKSLGEVVVNAGYWQVREKEQTGSISRVTSEIIGTQSVSNPLQSLQGRLPGIYIQQSNGMPGSNLTVRIRGQNSISSGNDPLYVIDNVPFTPGNLTNNATSAGILGTGGISPLNSINPSDIESIEVLKDADATAIYGSRGANGVILITTKKGKAGAHGKPSVRINANTGFSQVGRKMKMLNTIGYLTMRREAFQNDNTSPTVSNGQDLLLWDTTRYTDWQETLIGGTARSTNVQASISGGNEHTTFSWAGGFEKNGLPFPGDLDSKKISSRLSTTHTSADKRFKGEMSVTYSRNISNLLRNDLTSTAINLSPNAPSLYDETGKLNWENGTWQNPLSELERKYDNNITNLLANLNLAFRPWKNLTVSTSVGFNEMKLNDKNTTPSAYYNPAFGATPEFSQLYVNNSASNTWIIEPKLDWNKTIGKGTLSALVGSTLQEQKTQRLVQYGRGFTSDVLINDISAAADITILDYSDITYRYTAVFGRLNYSLSEKYFLNTTMRRDGSSRFGPGKRFGNFGAIGAAWILSGEDFFQRSLPFVSFAKLRSSYGTTGNDQIGDYQFLDTFQPGGAPYQGVIGLSPVRLLNPDFAWEVNRKFEGALELGFLRDRIHITTGYYINRSSNQLVNYPISAVTGFTGVQANLDATVENRGLEIAINSINVENAKFSWSTDLNFTRPRNVLVSFPLLEASGYASRYVVGESLTINKGYNYVGIDPETGIYQFEDMNGDGAITLADRLQVTNAGVKYHGGMNNTIRIGSFQADFFFQFVRQSGVNYWASVTVFPGSRFNQPERVVENRWTAPGQDDRSIQRFTMGVNGQAVTAFFTHYTGSNAVITDASFIRLKNVSLSWQMPASWTRHFKCRLYAQGQNLLTFTNYFGLDPENMRSATLPPLRTMVLGLDVTF